MTGIEGDDRQRAAVEAVIQLTRAFSVQVIAEGVETSAELDILKLLECGYAQGYFLARPEAPEEISMWWAHRRALP